MPETFELRILRPQDLENVLAYAQSGLEKEHSDPMERQFAAWSAPWRQEALQHYLGTGWSFAAFEKQSDKLLGFALAQPFLFFHGLTQTVWVEHLQAENQEVGQGLVDTLYRWSRDKHIQKLIFKDAGNAKAWSAEFKGQLSTQGQWWELPTTKMRT